MVSAVSITFLGTASAVPTVHRNHSSLALKLDGDVWLFDCGEGTQKQVQQATHGIRTGAIKRIFITHTHGDHIFGLVPLLAAVLNGAGGTVDVPDPRLDAAPAAAAAPSAPPLEIYGPRGLRQYIRASLSCTYTNLAAPFRAHELLFPGEIPSAPADSGLDHAELPGSDIRCKAGTRIFPAFLKLADLEVDAGPIAHSVPCLGFVVRETRVPGRIEPAKYLPHIQRNQAALLAAGIAKPMGLMARLQAGENIVLPDGTTLEPPAERPGRRIAILGDTYDASGVSGLVEGVNVLIHEATNAFLPELDPTTKADDTEETVEQRSREHGHSTPQVAGRFAKRVGARRLVLNHFSNRYRGDDEEASLKVMEGIRALAVKEFGSEEVLCARDFTRIEVPKRQA